MADQDRNKVPSGDEVDRQQADRNPNRNAKDNDQNSEWLIGQMGEDDNLSGSSTYRTLPDQPKEGRDDSDAKDRQSNR
ncbi:MAG TPA: hypothetical protein VF159_05385 [Gemmatimonadaceae bacterium]